MKRWLIGLATSFVPLMALGQDTTSTTLPDIAPHEVEIRGTLEVSLPSLQRRPFVGDNPPVQVPEVTRDTPPFIAEYKPAAFELSRTALERPDPPSFVSTAKPPAQFLIGAFGGYYLNRGVNTRLTIPVSESMQIFTHGMYRGSYGHIPPFDETGTFRSEFDTAEFQGGLRASGGWWKADIQASGYYDSFALFGRKSLPTAPQRDITGLSGRMTVGTLGESLIQSQVSLEGTSTRFWTRHKDLTSTYLNEGQIAVNADIRYDVGGGDLWLEGMLSQAQRQQAIRTSTTFSIGGGLDVQASRMAGFTFGVIGIGIRNDVGPGEDGAFQTVVPVVRIQFRPARRFVMYAGSHPQTNANSAAETFRMNPYLKAHPDLRPSLMPVNVEYGLAWYVGHAQLSVRGGRQEASQFLYYTIDDNGLPAASYDEVEIVYGGASFSYVILEGLHFIVRGSRRTGRLGGTDASIPYLAPITVESVVSYTFARERGYLQLRGYYEGRHTIDLPSGAPEVGRYIDVDVSVTYHFTPLIGMLLRIENIGQSDNSLWHGYPGPPRVVGVGLQVRW